MLCDFDPKTGENCQGRDTDHADLYTLKRFLQKVIETSDVWCMLGGVGLKGGFPTPPGYMLHLLLPV